MTTRIKTGYRRFASLLVSWGGFALIIAAAIPAALLMVVICTVEEVMDSALKKINRQ